MTPPIIAEAFLTQASHCANLESPFMARLCTLLATRDWPAGPLSRRIFQWAGNPSHRADAVPLRLCGALHALRLKGDDGLTLTYPPHDVSDDALWRAVCAALTDHATFIDHFIDSPPQTNKVRRAGGLIAAVHLLHARYPLPFRITELGASGGLNLMFDRFALALPGVTLGPSDPALTLNPDWSGPLPPAKAPIIADRAGVDLNPLDPKNSDDALRLQAYLWADQPHRLALTGAAMTVANAPVERADAIDGLTPRLRHIPGQLHLIYHTIAWQYFPPNRQALGRERITAAGASAARNSPLAWLGIEADGTEPGAALTLRLWPGDLTVQLGRMDFHGRWIDWTATD